MKGKALLFAFVLAFTFLAAAATGVKKQDIVLPIQTSVAGATLKPGVYQVAVDGGFVIFFRDGKEVAKAAVQGADSGKKFDSTETVIAADGHSIEEIDLAGATTKWTLSGSQREQQ